MRELIGQTLEVVATVEETRPKNRAEVEIKRKSAIIKVAFAHSIEPSTISDKYRRQLGLGLIDNCSEPVPDCSRGCFPDTGSV